MLKREQWTEADLVNLPTEEPDNFERKSGKLFQDQGKFLDATAKALSAFANSGGGSLLLGVQDDGTLDGLPPLVGRTAMKDWIEQKIPYLVDYPLSDFRVHTVIKADPSAIPNGQEIIVIDVGDSAAAPHQSKRDNLYYHRVGGRSLPAPHFYLELLRQRLTNAELDFTLEKGRLIDIKIVDGRLYFYFELTFDIENVGRVASYNWRLSIRQLSHDNDGFLSSRADSFYFGNYPIQITRNSGIALDRTILPACTFSETKDFAVLVPDTADTAEAVRQELTEMLSVKFNFQLATENSPGALKSVVPLSVLDIDDLVNSARTKTPEYFFKPDWPPPISR